MSRSFEKYILQDKSLDLGANSYYFAETHNGKIILGNSTGPLTLTEIDSTFTTFRHHTIQLDYYGHAFKSLTLYIRNSYFYLADGTVPVIYRGNNSCIRESIIPHAITHFF